MQSSMERQNPGFEHSLPLLDGCASVPAAALATVPCMRPGQRLHVYGFNWNPQAWFMLKMGSEQVIIKRLFRGLDVSIHPTACDGMYTCHKLCDGLFYRIAKDGDKAVCEAKVLPSHPPDAAAALFGH